MNEVFTRNVSDLPESSRRSLEDLVGHVLTGDQQLFIVIAPKPTAETDVAQAEALSIELQQWDRAADEDFRSFEKGLESGQ